MAFRHDRPSDRGKTRTAGSLLRAGGIYFIDDLRPQPNWPDGHGLKVAALIEALGRSGLAIASLDCASGLMLAVRASRDPRPSPS